MKSVFAYFSVKVGECDALLTKYFCLLIAHTLS